MAYVATYSAPVGAMILKADDNGALCALFFDTRSQWEIIPACKAAESVFRPVRAWLDAYFRGENPEIGRIALAPQGTPFQQAVWKKLSNIPYGKTVTYGEIALAFCGKDKHSGRYAQAVGRAVGSNPIAILLPCHRVVGANGNLTGYAGGLDKKIWLLRHEGVDMTRFYLPGKPGVPIE